MVVITNIGVLIRAFMILHLINVLTRRMINIVIMIGFGASRGPGRPMAKPGSLVIGAVGPARFAPESSVP